MSAPWVLRQRQELRQLMQDYNANPCVKLNTSVAIKSKDMKPPRKLPSWPKQIKPGAWIKWAERNDRGQKVARIKQGRVMSVEQKNARIYTGKYSETINLVDLYIGEVKIL
jgi:hypothetical protein